MNNLGDDGALIVSDLLGGNSSELDDLDLEYNCLGDFDCVQDLILHEFLTRLTLSNNSIDDSFIYGTILRKLLLTMKKLKF